MTRRENAYALALASQAIPRGYVWRTAVALILCPGYYRQRHGDCNAHAQAVCPCDHRALAAAPRGCISASALVDRRRAARRAEPQALATHNLAHHRPQRWSHHAGG